jgi:hypothetical protein
MDSEVMDIFGSECHNFQIIVREICNMPDGFSGNGRGEFAAFWEAMIGHNMVLNSF